jgi:hypothetical protein
MKTFIKKTTDTIIIPDNFATLEAKVGNNYHYHIRYLADPTKAAQQQAFLVRINISKKPYVKKRPPIFSDFVNSLIIDKLQSMQSARKDVARSTSDDYIITYVSDITAKIPNSMAKGLRRNSGKKTYASAKRVVAKTVADLREQNVTSPILETNLSRGTEISNEESSKSSAHEMLFNNGKDPASFSINKTQTIRTADMAIAGLVSKPNFVLGSKLFGKSIASTLLNRSVSFNTDELNENEVIGVVEQVNQSFIEISETIEIPTSALVDEDDFYVVFELINQRNYPIQISSNLVTHGKNLRLLRIPTKPPTIIGSSIVRPGKILFDVKQEDDNATGIAIYKKIINGSQASISADFSYVGKFDIRKSDGIKRIDDLEAGLGKVIYRFIPYSDESNLSSVFATTSVSFTKPVGIRNVRRLQKQSFVSITGEVRTYGISVTIRELPPNAIAVQLQRRNLSRGQKKAEVVGNGSILLNLKGDNAITVDDTAVSKGRIYEYSVLITYKDGATIPGANTLVIEYSPVVSNIVSTTISQPQLITGADGYDVVFQLILKVLNNETELVKKLIAEQGLQAEFQEEITANRQNLSKLFTFQITRENLTTGERESFGTIDSPNFSDRKYGAPKNVKPIDPGSVYEYTVVTQFRNPETLFPTLARKVATGNKSHIIKPFKWYHPVTLRDGNIVSPESLKRNHAKDSFQQGVVADIQKVSVSIANVMPTVSNAKVTRVRDNANLIQWTINGNPSKIDHYVIAMEVLGIRTIVGAAHSIGTSNYYEFLDPLDNNEKGALSYIIVPIYYDYSKGVETKTNTVVI